MRLQRWLYKAPLRLRSLFRRNDVEQELTDELQFHIERQTQDFVAKGMNREDARYAALAAMHGIEQRKEECREARRVSAIEHAIQDLRYGLRVLRKNPGFSFAVIATLALGIGATTAIFSVVYGVILRPLPFRDPGQLVSLSTVFSNSVITRGTGMSNYRDWRAQNTVFEEMGLIKFVQNFNITGDGEPERVLGARSTASVFRVFGASAMLGRVFTEEDGDTEDKVVLGYGLWQSRYGKDPAIIGKTIRLNGTPYLVLGIMPPEFQYRDYALWTPLKINPDESRGTIDYACIARLKKDVTLAQARQQMAAIQTRVSKEHPEIPGWTADVSTLLEDVVRNVRTSLYLLFGAVACLLLIGCVNLANMLVARSITRRQELVVRTALGANRRRLVLQSIMEVVPLLVLGGLLGLLLAHSGLTALVPLLPEAMPRVDAIEMNWQVLAFAMFLLVAMAVLVGLWPGLQAVRWNIASSLRESGRTATSAGGGVRLRNGLVITQIAAVVVLMIVSALLIRSFAALRNVDPGFRWDNILSVHLAISESEYPDNAAFGRFCRQIVERVSAIPGVVSAGMVNRLPLAGQTQTGSLDFDDTNLPRNSGTVLNVGAFDWRVATPGYFETLGIPLIEGRFFNESDTADGRRVGIVDERVARMMWPNQSAIGKRFRFPLGLTPNWYEIVGVVGHVKHDGLGIDPRPQVYWSYHQRRQPRMALAVRTSGDPNLMTRSVIAAIHEVAPEQPVYDVRSMEDVVDRSLSQQWLTTALLSLFACVALVLATVGVYGVLSYSVGLRTREIGIRMALGSRPQQVIWMILRQGGSLAGVGIGIGLGGALLLGGLLSTFVYGITARDALSFVSASLILLGVALAASYVPARRAASVDPMSVLRTE